MSPGPIFSSLLHALSFTWQDVRGYFTNIMLCHVCLQRVWP